LRVCAEGPPEQQDEGLRVVDLVVDPPARLLHANLAPLVLQQETLGRQLLVELAGQQNVAVLILIVLILLAVFNVVGEVRHNFLLVLN